jgi:hypothetical protein
MAMLSPNERCDVVNDIWTATAGEAIAFDRACVVLSASRTVVKTTADTDLAAGLMKIDGSAPSSGDQVEYIERGHLHFIAGGAISQNDPLCPDDGTAGRVRTAVSGDMVIGYALEDASGAGVRGLGKFDFANPHLLA